MKKVPEILAEAAKTYRERSDMYPGTYYDHGKIMKVFFPEGLKLDTVEDFNRFGLFHELVKKLHRYSKSREDGGHQDSIHDLGVYAFMLEELDGFYKGP